MSESVSTFFDWLAALSPVWAYTILLIIAYGENVLPPIPGDLVVVFGGYLAGIGRLNLFVVILLSTMGGTLGFMTMFAIGFKIGTAVLDPGRLRWLPKEQIGKAKAWLERWGYGVVAANRFLSGARSVISLAAGMAELNPPRTAVYATLSSLVWTSLITFAGYQVGENWQVIGEYLRQYGRIMLVVLVVLVVVLAARYYVKRGKKAEPNAE